MTLEDYAIVGGQTGVHQFCRVGAHAMVGGVAAVTRTFCDGKRRLFSGPPCYRC